MVQNLPPGGQPPQLADPSNLKIKVSPFSPNQKKEAQMSDDLEQEQNFSFPQPGLKSRRDQYSFHSPTQRAGSIYLPDIPDVPQLLIFIKPWDDEVFLNLMSLLKFIDKSEAEMGITVQVVMPQDLLKNVQKQLRDADWGIQKVFDIALDDEIKQNIDYIITLGGDGTLLYAAKQYNTQKVPPIISLSQGSLGFMTNFDFSDHERILTAIFKSVQTRSSLQLQKELGQESRLRLHVNAGPGTSPDRQIFRGDQLQHSEPLKLENIHVLNEVVIDRGPSPYTVQLNVYIDGNKITTAVGDGLIIATPTGSTAYNLAAGGSILEANSHCICLTPLAPHSLSFRPIILNAKVSIRIEKVKDERNSAWVSLDGANRFMLTDGESIVIQGSDLALNLVTMRSDNLTDLWAQRLVKFFGWNTRETNKPLQKRQSAFYDPSKLTEDIDWQK